jgi:hypothetical protein
MMITQYYDFVLVIDREKSNESEVGKLTVTVRVLESPAGESQSPETVSIPSTLGRSLRQLENRNLDPKDIIALGEELGHVLLPKNARNLFINSLERLRSDEGLRLRVKLDSRLAGIPWEYLYIQDLSGSKRDSRGFCALHPKISLVRHELVSKAPQLNTSPKPRRLLVALASPQNEELLDTAKERANIESALTDIPGIKAEFIENATAEGLIEQLIPGTDIFHFAGHGRFKTSHLDANRGAIVLLDEDGNSAPMSAEQLAMNLRGRGVQLVVLGACETGRRDGQNVWDGVVAALMEAEIPAAVAMQYKIWDRSAIAFSRNFYKALAAGLPLDQAVSAGRLAVFNLCDSLPDEEKQRYWRDWGVPVLYWRGEGNFILPTTTDESQRQALLNDEVVQPTVLSQFQSLIQDKTEGFVGREYVFDAIQTFIQQNPKGYFTIIGDPGMGKSAILAKYVQHNRCIAYFNLRSEGFTTTDQFLNNIANQLIEAYKLNYRLKVLPDRNFLRSLLEEVSKRLNSQERLVIAIDALDEVDLSSHTSGANILYLPHSLPKGIYFILTRRNVTLPLTVDPSTPQLLLDLRDYGEQSLKDVQTYIRQRIAENNLLKKRISFKRITEEEFLVKLSSKSDNNFMYLCYVLGDIESVGYENLNMESLPQGLEGYYEGHWDRMKLNEQPPPRGKLKIVYFLAVARQPVTSRVIA